MSLPPTSTYLQLQELLAQLAHGDGAGARRDSETKSEVARLSQPFAQRALGVARRSRKEEGCRMREAGGKSGEGGAVRSGLDKSKRIRRRS